MLRMMGAAAAALALAACTGETPAPSSAQTPDAILRGIGYTVLVPPTTTFRPGMLVLKKNVEGLAPGQVALGLLCTQEFTSFPPTLRDSPSSAMGAARERAFEIEGGALQALGLGAQAEAVERVSLRFENTRVLDYSQEDLDAIREALGPRCAATFERFTARGNAHQVLSAFQADLSYDVAFHGGASAEARTAVLGALSARLGGAAGSAESTSGRGLIYGVQLCPAGDCAGPAPADGA
jgi:hypothetical protein